MATDPFLLVSLKEEQAKKLAQVISNDTCRKILASLAKKSYTETELSKYLAVPLSTIHYNVSALVDAKLVKADEFHYSEKGKEVLHYSLANKYVIIAQEAAPSGFVDKLREILPVALIVGAVGAVMAAITRFAAQASFGPGMMRQTITADSANAASQKLAAGFAAPAAMEASETLVQNPGTFFSSLLPSILWFVVGALFALLVFALYSHLKERRRKP
ncbi:hypothetical protein COY95_02020 [Candidatus Woesearchaeota archaeon CG_4_10_14_0_8_um_filter_47_5]|nr:MAG: hypothetical protein COY95_02020 [Candidatus Woesearchaeota archaeon CG_4_10_14_0_8_um_filter_47_5]